MIGPRSVSADVAAAQMPEGAGPAGPSNVAVMIASEPGTSSAPAAPWRSRATISSSRVGARPHRTRRDAEAGEADDEDPPPAVVVGEGAGEDRAAPPAPRGSRWRRTPGPRATPRTSSAAPGRSSAARRSRWCRRGRRSPSRGWPRAGSSAGSGSSAGGSASGGQCASVQATAVRHHAPDAGRPARARIVSRWSAPASSFPRWRRSTAACSRRPVAARPRVAILPTASWPDGEDVFQRWAAMGVEHFTALGAEVEPVLVRDRRRSPMTRPTSRRSARRT